MAQRMSEPMHPLTAISTVVGIIAGVAYLSRERPSDTTTTAGGGKAGVHVSKIFKKTSVTGGNHGPEAGDYTRVVLAGGPFPPVPFLLTVEASARLPDCGTYRFDDTLRFEPGDGNQVMVHESTTVPDAPRGKPTPGGPVLPEGCPPDSPPIVEVSQTNMGGGKGNIIVNFLGTKGMVVAWTIKAKAAPTP